MGQNPRVRFAVAVVVLVAAGAAHADDRTPVTLEAVLAAAGKAPAAQIGAHDIEAAEATYDAASAWPMSGLRVGANRLTAKVVAGVSIPLPIFGTIGAARHVAAAEADVVRAEADLALRDLRHRIVVAWIELLRAGGDVAASRVAAQQAADLQTIAKGRLDAGTGADVDVTVASAARARADVAVRSGDPCRGCGVGGARRVARLGSERGRCARTATR